jgi:hypothetical protein
VFFTVFPFTVSVMDVIVFFLVGLQAPREAVVGLIPAPFALEVWMGGGEHGVAHASAFSVVASLVESVGTLRVSPLCP